MKLTIAAFCLYTISITSYAADESWKYTSAGDIQVAKTTNEGGSIAGILCNSSHDGCAAYIAISADCDEDSSYPMMINSGAGSLSLTATCTIWDKAKYFVFNEFAFVVTAFESGGDVGFAMPMASGQFRVIRFKTNGAAKAISKARTRPAEKKSNRALSDQVI